MPTASPTSHVKVKFSKTILNDLHGVDYYVAKIILQQIVDDACEGVLLTSSEICTDVPTCREAYFVKTLSKWFFHHTVVLPILFSVTRVDKKHTYSIDSYQIIAIDISFWDRLWMKICSDFKTDNNLSTE